MRSFLSGPAYFGGLAIALQNFWKRRCSLPDLREMVLETVVSDLINPLACGIEESGFPILILYERRSVDRFFHFLPGLPGHGNF